MSRWREWLFCVAVLTIEVRLAEKAKEDEKTIREVVPQHGGFLQRLSPKEPQILGVA
jgi:hypothetical protein